MRAVLGAVLGLALHGVHAQNAPPVLDQIIVTATRVETDLQRTPMSVDALLTEDLELAGIGATRDLGIMVPNAVINPGNNEASPVIIVRGLPGVAIYVDGIWHGNDTLQRTFVELERVEVLRGPQGTLFGRNTNGGAIQLITRPPADEFGVRIDMEVGEFGSRILRLSADVPVTDRLRTKWTGAMARNDGFLENPTADFSLGDRDDSLLRADILWEPTGRLSLRFVVRDEDMQTADARVVRISNPQNAVLTAYNVLAGNADFLEQARDVDDTFPDPPFALAGDRFTAETHEAGFPGGSLGKWQTRSDTPGPTTVVDSRSVTVTGNWSITDRLTLESLTSYAEADSQQLIDYDASEFTLTTDLIRSRYEGVSQEFHLNGSYWHDRLRFLLGFYYLGNDFRQRYARWGLWEFAIPNSGPNPGSVGPPGVGGRPDSNQAAVDYVRAWGAAVGNPSIAMFSPPTFITQDTLTRGLDIDRAYFGTLSIGLTDAVDLTLGIRFTDDDRTGYRYLPADSFRPPVPAAVPAGNPYAVAATLETKDVPDPGTVSTPRASVSYQVTDDIYVYASYAEGFTSSEIIDIPILPEPVTLDPEVVKTREIGLRSEWLGGRLRLNATYFDSDWDGLRVPKSLTDPDTGQPLPFVRVPTSDGLATSSGFELELFYLPGARWEVDFGLGLLDTEYLDIGDPPANGSGLQPGIPFQYAPESSYALGLRHWLSLSNGAELRFAGQYGWMDEYQRASPAEFQTKNTDGSTSFEPAYGILNASVAYLSRSGNWQVSLFGSNLTNEWYVNGGLDTGLFWGYDYGTIGRPRELGVALRLMFD